MVASNHSQVEVTGLTRDRRLNPPTLPLGLNEVHVWDFPVTGDTSLDPFSTLLSPDEQVRAARFRFEKDTRRFTVTRASARSILARYLAGSARDLQFEYTKLGKPSLTSASLNIDFSVSHSGELAMLAIALEHSIGVDLEFTRRDVEIEKLSERFFSTTERESIRALSGADRVAAFFRCWTCKEAFLKAQGVGLSRSLDSFDVEVDIRRPARLLATRPDTSEAAAWSLHQIQTAVDYAAAVAVQGQISTIKILRCR